MSDFSDYMSAASNPIASGLNFFAGNYMMDKQNELNIQQWNRENKYNLPVNQVSRLLAAGLNPALMYQNGSSGLVSAASPEMRSVQPNFQGLDPMTAAQIRLLDAQRQSVQDANDRENEKQPLTLDSMRKQIDKLDSETAVNDTQVFLNNALTGKAREEAANLWQNTKFLMESFANRLNILQSQQTIDAAKAKYAEQTALEAYNSLKEQAKFYIANAKAVVTAANAAYKNAQTNEKNFKLNRWLAGWNVGIGKYNAKTERMQVISFANKCAKEIEEIDAQIEYIKSNTTSKDVSVWTGIWNTLLRTAGVVGGLCMMAVPGGQVPGAFVATSSVGSFAF